MPQYNPLAIPDIVTEENRRLLERRGVYRPSGSRVNPETGKPEWGAGGFRNPGRVAGTVPESAGNIGPNYERRLEALDVNRNDDFFGNFPVDNEALGKEYARALAERLADQAANRNQQLEQGRALTNPLPTQLKTSDRQQFIDQHPMSEEPVRVRTAMSDDNDRVLADMAKENQGISTSMAAENQEVLSQGTPQPAPEIIPFQSRLGLFNAEASTETNAAAYADSVKSFLGQLQQNPEAINQVGTRQQYEELLRTLSGSQVAGQAGALREAGERFLAQVNPQLYRQMSDQNLVETKNQDVMAGWYRQQVEPGKNLSNAQIAEKVAATPELKSKFALEVGEVAGPGGMSLPLNPEVRDVLSVRLSKDQENISYGGSTVGDAINKAQRLILASSGMTKEARASARSAAIMAAGDALDAVRTRLNETKAMIDSGATSSVVQLGIQGAAASPKIKDLAFNEVKARVGEDSLLQSYAPIIQNVTLNSAAILPKTGIVKPVEGGATEDLIKYYPGNGIPEMVGQVVIDLQATINKDKPMSADEMQAALESSITKVLSNNSKRIDAFSEEAGQRVIGDLEAAVKQRLGDEWKQTSERADNELMVGKILPMVSSFIDDSAMVLKWTPDKAGFEYLATANLLSDGSQASKQFVQQLDINGNQTIDRPEEFAAAWMVKRYGAGIIPIARQLAEGTFRITGDREQARQLYDGFTALVDQFSGGMAEAAIKTSARVTAQYDKLAANFDQVRRMPPVDQTREAQEWRQYRASGVVPDTEWLSAANPEANVVKVGEQQYLARNPVVAQVFRDAFGSTLNADTKNALLNVINVKNGYLGDGLDRNKLRIITGAIGNNDDALVDIANPKDDAFFRAMNADYNAEVKKVAGKQERDAFLAPGAPRVRTMYGATVDNISIAPIKTAIGNDPQLSLLWRMGVDGNNPSLSRMAYQLAREKVRDEISADMGKDIRNTLPIYLAGLRDVLGVDRSLDPDADRQKLMQALVAKYRPAIVEAGSAADSIEARDIVDKIGTLAKEVRAKRDSYRQLGLEEVGENSSSIDGNLTWMDKLVTEFKPARPQATGTQQNVVTTAVAGGQQ